MILDRIAESQPLDVNSTQLETTDWGGIPRLPQLPEDQSTDLVNAFSGLRI
jgi:hypothetical protein